MRLCKTDEPLPPIPEQCTYIGRLKLSFYEAMIYCDLDRVRLRDMLDDYAIPRSHIEIRRLDQALATRELDRRYGGSWRR